MKCRDIFREGNRLDFQSIRRSYFISARISVIWLPIIPTPPYPVCPYYLNDYMFIKKILFATVYSLLIFGQ